MNKLLRDILSSARNLACVTSARLLQYFQSFISLRVTFSGLEYHLTTVYSLNTWPSTKFALVYHVSWLSWANSYVLLPVTVGFLRNHVHTRSDWCKQVTNFKRPRNLQLLEFYSFTQLVPLFSKWMIPNVPNLFTELRETPLQSNFDLIACLTTSIREHTGSNTHQIKI